VTVTEEAIGTAMGKLVAEERVIAEGAAATAIAGVLGGRLAVAGRRVAVILSGANVDPHKLRELI
jgi:threonine dehydratase